MTDTRGATITLRAAKSCLLLVILSLVIANGLRVPSAIAQDIGQESTTRAPEAAASQNNEQNQSVRPGFKLPKIFDFERFKQVFKKVYSSPLEEMRRLKLFLARSWRAIISAVGYKHRGSSYYLSVNERSDMTQEELKMGENRFLSTDETDSDSAIEEIESQEGEVDATADEPLSPEDLEAELAKVEQRSNEPGYAQLAEELREAREQVEPKSRRRRSADFDIERTFDNAWFGGGGSEDDDDDESSTTTQLQQVKPKAKESTGNFQTRDEAFVGLKEKRLMEGEWRYYGDLPVRSQYRVESLMDRFFKLFSKDKGEMRAAMGEDDVVWVDHRDSGCLAPVQNQWICGACYSFTLISFFEWVNCKETGEFTKFSEQYMLDCGPRLGMMGCLGGNVERAGLFVSNFGLELASHYPYVGLTQMCPYAPETERTHMGYISLDVGDMSRIPLGFADEYLKHTPMVITIDIAGDFHEYGGGVWDGLKCEPRPLHAMMLIGHGRQDGEEYWLIRNSWGPLWGEAGYMKLNKNSRCINPSQGLIWGSSNGKEFKLSPKRNEHVPIPVAKDAAYALKNIKYTAQTLDQVTGFKIGG